MTQIKHHRFLLVLTVLAAAVLLSACGSAPAESWPGVTLDAESQTAYVAHGTHLYQVNVTNGQEVWRFPTEAGRTNFYAPPLHTDNGELLVGGYDHLFYSIKPGSEQPNWTFTGAADRYVGKPLVMGETVFAPSADNHLYALGLQDGVKRWDFAAGHSLWAAPVADSDVLYQASMDHHVYALNVQDGSVAWDSGDLGGQIVAAPAVHSNGSRLYTAIFGSKVDDPARSSQLIALDAATGKVAWNLPIAGWVWATPALHEDTLYFGDTAGYFYAVDAQQGQLRWKYPQSGEPKSQTGILGAPAIAGERVYFGTEAGMLTALNLADGSMLWEKGPWDQGKTGQIYASLHSADNLILIAPTNYDNGILMAVDLDGNFKWQFLPARK